MSPTAALSFIARWLKRIGLGVLAVVIVATLVGSVTEFVGRRQARTKYPPRGQIVDIGGRRMHLDCRGQGTPTVILESGLDTNGSLSWDKVQDPLSAVTRTCSYDRAGVMWSDPKEGPQDADGVADDLHATLKAAGIQSPYVMVCHSLGGPYIMDYTRKYGDEVSGLVFVDCSHPDQIAKLGPKLPRADQVPLLYRALNALAWTGIARLAPDPGVPGMPDRIKPIGKAYFGETFGASLKEMEAIPATFREGGALRDLGDRPLVVLNAVHPYPVEMLQAFGMTPQDGVELVGRWEQLGKDEATWSRRSRQQSVPDSLHYIQFQRPDLVIKAVTEVVGQVRESAGTSAPTSTN
jgi:pimeloyl-ACP methyl ester carboxylesterase